MLRERALKVLVVLLGLFFCVGIYPIAEALWHPDAAEDYGDYMMLSLYVTLGVFLLIAARDPNEQRKHMAYLQSLTYARRPTRQHQNKSKENGYEHDYDP